MPEPERLEDIARSAGLFDALADERRIVANDAADIELIALLEGWRDDIRLHSHDDVVTDGEAAAALRDGLTTHHMHRPRRGFALVGSLAAAVMALGGFGAVIHGAGPGDSLYGLRSVLFGEVSSVRDDTVALAAKSEMAEVRQLIDNGKWEQAQERLEVISTKVADVGNQTVKQDLLDEWNQLNVKVENRDPAATVTPTSTDPGASPVSTSVPVTSTDTGATSTTPTTGTSGAETSTSSTATSPTSSTATSGSETTSAATTTSEATTATSSAATSSAATSSATSNAATSESAVTTTQTERAAPESAPTSAPTTEVPAAEPETSVQVPAGDQAPAGESAPAGEPAPAGGEAPTVHHAPASQRGLQLPQLPALPDLLN